MPLERLIRNIEKVVDPPTGLLFRFSWLIAGIMSLPIFVNVSIRFLTSKTVPGVLELEELMVVCVAFGAIPFMQRNKSHLDIDLLVSRFPEWVRTVLECFIYLVLSVFYGLMTWQMTLNTYRKMDEISPELEIPIAIFIAFGALSTALLTLVFLKDFLTALSRGISEGRLLWLLTALGAALLILLSPVLIKAVDIEVSRLILGFTGMALLFILLFLRMPIGFAMALVGFLGMWALTRGSMAPLRLIGGAPYAEMTSFIWAVFPLFVLMGELAFFTGMGSDLFDAAHKWFGSLRGSLAMSAVAGCASFAAVCGESLATAVTMGTIALPEMRKKKYHPGLATGAIAAGGTLGILIPPSMGFIVYAIITEESIGKLFVAGLLPGILLAFLFIVLIYIIARLDPSKAPRGEATSFKEKLRSLKGTIAMLVFFVLILGGIMGGIFSPNEGGAIGSVGTFIYALFRRRITKEMLIRAMQNTAIISTKIFAVVIGVGILNSFLASTRLPYLLSELVTNLDLNRFMILAIIVALYIGLGCVMNVVPIILLTMPAIFPTVLALNFDPIWFGVISVILMEMGQITPPIGIIVFAVGGVAKDIPMETIFKGIIPFVLCMILCVIILTVFPQIALYLPNLLFR